MGKSFTAVGSGVCVCVHVRVHLHVSTPYVCTSQNIREAGCAQIGF